MTDLPPHLAAKVDQWRAVLRDLTSKVADHKTVCDLPECIGHEVLDELQDNLLSLPALMAMCLIDRAAPAPDRRDVECAIIDAVAAWEGKPVTTAIAVVAALDRIGALRSQP